MSGCYRVIVADLEAHEGTFANNSQLKKMKKTFFVEFSAHAFHTMSYNVIFVLSKVFVDECGTAILL